MRWPLRRTWPRIARRLMAGVSLAAFLVVAIGIPLPARRMKDLTRPFPCQDHLCGCTSAEECWSHCCCYTHEEHLAWAREHHVEPPASFCKHDEPHEAPSCCTQHRDCCKKSEQPAASPSGVRWTSFVDALRCRGLTPLGTAVIAAVPPPPLVGWSFQPTHAGWIVPEESTPLRPSQLPLEPPPRV